jgi:two-component system nitrogen regulation sensor histidine kinase NtrY
MSFRTKLLAFFVVSIVAAVTLVAWGVAAYTRRGFEEFDRQRTDALVAQFRREFAQRGDEIAHRVQGIADSEATLRMAMDLTRPQADASQYYNDARGIAQTQQLDFVDIVGDDGTLISSFEWPARFGYKNDWVGLEPDWNSRGAFLRRVDMPDAVDLGLLAVRTVKVGERRLFVIGGQRLDQNFLGTLVLPEGMRVLLYRNLEQGFVPSELTDPRGALSQPELFSSMITDVQQSRREAQRTIATGTPPTANSETFNAIPLAGRDNDLLAVLLVGSSRQSLIQMLNFIRALALLVGGGVILLGLMLGWWVSARVTRPIEKLAEGAREVAAGRWEARVQVRSRDEIGQLADAFNEMTRQLAEQRERLVQTERVAAWRELARRLAHELKNPLFPLQLTVENLQRARQQTPDQFDEVFFESTATLRAELENLKTIVSRFSDFAKMPPPEFERVDVNELVRSTVKLFEPQLAPVGRPPITPELYLDEGLPRPQTIRTAHRPGAVRLEVTDTGEGLTPEECARLFTPYYTNKRHGTGLGLAIVQSVVSDHNGRIEVESAPGAGATFRIELPTEQKLAVERPSSAEDRPVESRPAEPRLLPQPDPVNHP